MGIRQHFYGKEWIATLVMGAIGLALSFAASFYVEKLNTEEAASEFQQMSGKLGQALERRLDSFEYGLRGLRGLMSVTQGKVSDRDFRLYMANRDITEEFPGALGFGHIRRLTQRQTPGYVAEQQRARALFHLQTFNVNPGDRFIVDIIEPHEVNWASLGMDIASDPVRRNAALMAMRSGMAILSEPIALEQDVRGEKGLLYLLPYYRPGMSISTQEERETALEGWLYAPILLKRLMLSLQESGESLFAYDLFWGDRAELGVKLFDYEANSNIPANPSESVKGPHGHKFSRDLKFSVGGQSLVMRVTSQPDFEAQYLKNYGVAVFMAGLAMTGLMCWSIWQMGLMRRRAIKLADELSSAARDGESQINAVLNNTVESIITVDKRGIIRSFNRAAQNLFGYREDEALGRNVGILLPDEQDEFDETAIRELIVLGKQSGSSSVMELKVGDRRGRVFVVEVSIGEFALEGDTVFVGLMRDISWKKQQEEEKEAIQERLRLALEAGGFGVWQWWPDVRRFEWDTNTYRLYGVEPADFHGDVESWTKLVHEEDLERAVMSMRSVFLDAGPVSDVIRVRWPDGSIHHHSVHLRVIHDGSGRPSAIGVSQDVTTQKMTEESLRVSEERFALAARAAQEGIWDWDLRNGQIWFSPQWKAHFGYRDDELENSLSMWEKLILPEDRDEALALVQRFNRGEIAQFQAIQRFRHKDGHVVFIRSRAVQLLNKQGEVARIVGSHEDITELLRQENDLRESRERLALTIDCAGLGTWDWDMAQNQIVYGGKWADMVGYSLDEISQNLVAWQMLVHPDDYPRAMAAYEAHWSGETSYFACEYRMRSKSGEWRWVMGVGQVVAYGENQRPLRMLGVNIDIHERKINEEALQESRLLAEEANRAKSEFLANISHEIRTPLNAVLGFSTLLIETPLNVRQADFVDSIHNAGDALLTLINDLLDFSKIEAGKLDLEMIEFDARSTLEETLDIVAARAAAKGLNLACLVESSVPARLVGDPARLRQILLNLLNNAVKFTEHGDVVARARAQLEADGRIRLRVEVSDTGIGITPEEQIKLFRPFAQADASTTRRFGGTGLGLSISRRLAEAMDGGIGVHSKAGAGSVFWFEVDLSTAPDSCELPLLPVHVLGQRVLVVDHHPVNRELLSLQLQSIGLLAECHASAEAALARLAEPACEGILAILDMQMPDMDGIHLGEKIHAMQRWADLPLLLVTSLVGSGLAADARAARFSSYLTKPIRQSQLLYCVQEALGIQAMPSQMRASQPLHSFNEWIAETHPQILLAEDNPVNQKVARLMLEGLGCRVDVVANGIAAVAALEAQDYDLVLMDCQMPEMDGFMATERIRAMPGSRGTIPIVALTANAFRADAERCFTAGMNDFVPKPFTRESLLQALVRWMPTLVSPGAGASSSLPVKVESAAVADTGLLEEELKNIQLAFELLQKNIGIDMRDELLALYFPTQDECLQALQVSISAGESQTACAMAHKLKGAAAQLGAKKMAELCLAVERAAREDDLSRASALLVHLNDLAAGLRQSIQFADA